LFSTLPAAAKGNLDRTFGSGGRSIVPVSGFEKIFDVALQADGKIVAIGYSSSIGGISRFLVCRYNADGSLDASFDGGGRADLTAYRDGAWYILQSTNNGLNSFHFGTAGNVPVTR
jgi:hypothetical protein